MKFLMPVKKQAQGKTRRLQCQMVKRRMAMAVREETAERRQKCRTVRRLTAAAALVTWVAGLAVTWAAAPAARRVSPTRQQMK